MIIGSICLLATALSAPEISWSVMHPVWPDLDYFNRVIRKADEYGHVDSFEACGRCGDPNGGLNGFLLYEPYPTAAKEVDRAWVERNRKLMNDIVAASHGSGRPFYYWHREVFMPKGVLKDIPELKDEDGEFDLLGKAYEKYLRWKIGAAFGAVPGLDGIVLTLTEADFSVIHNSNKDRYPPAKVVEHLVRIFAEEHERRGKRLIVRSFGSIAPDYEDIIAGAAAAAKDHKFEIETKVTAYDFDPFLPNNPFLRKVPGTTLGAECDGLGEYFGAGYFPAVQVPVIRRYVDDARAQGVDRYTIRIDRVGNSIFDSAQEINLYAYMRFIRDSKTTVEQVTDEWATKRWAKCPVEMKRLAALSFEAVKHTQFADESVAFHQNPPAPNFKYVKACGIFSIFRDGFDLHQAERFWGMLSERKVPGRKAILAEKDKAVAEAEEGYALVRTLKGRLPADEYARHLRAWRNIALVAKATREYFRCACAYFDDMDANAADAPRLTAASAAAEKAISSLMKNPNRTIDGYQDHCSPMGEDMDVAYLFPLRWFCHEFLREYKAEFAARQKFLGRQDVIDFVIPGGMYDDVRCWRTAMHASYQDVESGVPVRYAGNGIFPNGAVMVEFKEFRNAALEIDVDPERGATDYALEDVTSNGIRRVTVSKKGAAYPAIRSIALVHRDCLSGRTTKGLPLYAPGEEMTFEANLRGFGGRDRSKMSIVWKRTGDDGKTESGKAPADRLFVYRTSLDRPGFVRLEGRLVDEQGKPVCTERNGRRDPVIMDLGAGVDIANIRPAVPAPADFDAFWSKRLGKLAMADWRGRETLEEIASADESVRVYRLKVPAVEGVDLTGYLAVPKKPMRFAACAYFHGYGASFNAVHTQPPSAAMLKTYAKDRIFLSVCPHGFELGREEQYYKDFRKSLRSNGCEHGFDPAQNVDPEKPYYCGMSYRVLRALAYLKSRPEWNGKDLVVTGGSQGGLQSIWAAALDHDVTECNIFIPWNCDIGGTELGRNRGDWYVKWVPGLGYYDTCSMAPRIPASCRLVVTMAGLGDYICPPSGVMAFYNCLTCLKSITFVQNTQHGNQLESRPQRFSLP